MAGYLMKYKGKYRVKAHIDHSTNDFPRDIYGNIDTDDLYIQCAYGNQIYHYGHSTLVAYIPSVGRGHNILKALATKLCGMNFEKGYTGYNGRNDKKASGIGLYLCRRICNNLGHTIAVESSLGEGTIVRLDLFREKLKTE